jgi:predicted lipoprotein with Yx(FWY)xxD motif
MKSLLTSSAALAAVIAIAGCGGSGNASGGSGASAAKGTTVSAQRVGGAGTVLVDSGGMALYAPDQEKGGKILCTGGCTSIWKPLTIASGKPTGPGRLGVVKRPDGMRQVTADGRPLYTFAQDSAGKVTGNGASDNFGGMGFTWHVITSKGAPASSSKSGGSSSGSGGSAYSYGSY